MSEPKEINNQKTMIRQMGKEQLRYWAARLAGLGLNPKQKGYYQFMAIMGETFYKNDLTNDRAVMCEDIVTQGRCFDNAVAVAMAGERFGIQYHEGLALCYGLPIEHAFNVAGGSMYDYTAALHWTGEADEWFGVRVPHEVLVAYCYNLDKVGYTTPLQFFYNELSMHMDSSEPLLSGYEYEGLDVEDMIDNFIDHLKASNAAV